MAGVPEWNIGAMSVARGTLRAHNRSGDLVNHLLLVAALIRPRRDDHGAAAVEYALIAAAVLLAVAGIDFLKEALDGFFGGQQDTVDDWAPSS